MNDHELLAYFRRGLIPGPDESQESFSLRVQKNTPLNHFEWAAVAEKTKHFGWAIDWMPIVYSNYKLAWWEGAATWISEKPFIQLRTGFQKGSYLGYSRLDVLAHEAVHAARIEFKEPLFEEMLAYSVAPQKWKRFFGPLFSRSWEPLVLLLAFIAGGFWWFVPVIALAFCVGWLSWRRSIFKKCCRALPLPVVLCLTDQEIKRFTSEAEFKAYLETGSNLRFQLLKILLQESVQVRELLHRQRV
jgi:hypothetical protein